MMKHLTSGTVKNRKSALRDDAPPDPPPPFYAAFLTAGSGRGPRVVWGRPALPPKTCESFQKLREVLKMFAEICWRF